MNPRRLFVASCIALIASAFSFVTRGDILPALGQTFNLSQTSRGSILGSAFWGMAAAMFVGSFIVDALGMKRMLGLAFLGHLVGSVMTIGSPYFVDPANSNAAYNVLWYATFLIGCANGFVEIGINPLAATLYPTEKTHRLNILHAWWPGGLMLGGLICYAIDQGMGLTADGVTPATVKLGWQIKSGLILVPTIIYGVLFLHRALPRHRAGRLGGLHGRDVRADLPADVPALGLLHAPDGLDRAGAAVVAELGPPADGGGQRDLDRGLHQQPDVRHAALRRADRPCGSRRSAC